MRQLSGKGPGLNVQEQRKRTEDEAQENKLLEAAKRWGIEGATADQTADGTGPSDAPVFERRTVTGGKLLVLPAGEMFGEQVRT